MRCHTTAHCLDGSSDAEGFNAAPTDLSIPTSPSRRPTLKFSIKQIKRLNKAAARLCNEYKDATEGKTALHFLTEALEEGEHGSKGLVALERLVVDQKAVANARNVGRSVR